MYCKSLSMYSITFSNISVCKHNILKRVCAMILCYTRGRCLPLWTNHWPVTASSPCRRLMKGVYIHNASLLLMWRGGERKSGHKLHMHMAYWAYGGEVSSQLFLLHSFCSLVPSVLSFSWSEPPALWQKSASPSEGQASSCKGCSLREDGLQVKWKAGRLCRNSMGNWLYKARTIIWVTSDTFPPIPADILPPSCRDLRLHAESLRLNIDAHLSQQHGSGSAGERWTKSHAVELKSSAACFTEQNRQPYGCLVLSAQPPWEMVFVRVIKLSHNPITSVIFMIQSLCLAGQLDKC